MTATADKEAIANREVLGVNITGGPDPHSIKVVNAKSGEEIKGITSIDVHYRLDGTYATLNVLVNKLDINTLGQIVTEEVVKEKKNNCGGKGCGGTP